MRTWYELQYLLNDISDLDVFPNCTTSLHQVCRFHSVPNQAKVDWTEFHLISLPSRQWDYGSKWSTSKRKIIERYWFKQRNSFIPSSRLYLGFHFYQYSAVHRFVFRQTYTSSTRSFIFTEAPANSYVWNTNFHALHFSVYSLFVLGDTKNHVILQLLSLLRNNNNRIFTDSIGQTFTAINTRLRFIHYLC